jgi:hypothetical protein
MTADSAPAGPDIRPRLGLAAAAAAARRAVAEFTGLEVDAVSACRPAGEGWHVVVDAVEAPARLGDADLLATYEIELDPAGEVSAFARTRRYVRAEGAA